MSNSVPEGWNIYSLDELGQVVGGGTPESNNTDYWGGDIYWATPKEITKLSSRYINKTERTITQDGLDRSSAKLHPIGTILLTSRASVGYPAINTIPMATNQGFQSLRPNNKLDTEYGYQCLLNSRNKLEKLSAGSTFLEISSKEVKKFKVVIPPLPEQKKIAAILTSVDTVIEKTQAQIDKLKDLKTGMMQELLTKGIGHTEFKDSPVGRIPVEWEVKDLGDLAFKIEGGGTPPRKNPDYWGKGYPWATVKDLKSIRLSSTEESITKTGLINSSSKLVPAGTVILATRMAVGKAVVFDCDVTINQDLKAFYPKEKLNNKFLLQWYLYKSKYIASLGTGSTVKGIRVDDLKLLIIAVPPYDEQIIIANKIEGIEVLLNHKIAKIQKMTSLKKALMQDLLTGKVRVKV